ncbi:MAG: family 16 glycoside hydrolase [Microcystaceae cyanobacterium]
MKRYICQDCGHQVIAAQKPSACEVCNGTILLPFEGKKSLNGKSDKPRTMIDVTGFGVKKPIPNPSPLPPLPPPPPAPPKATRKPSQPRGRHPSRQASSPSHSHSPKKTQYTPGSFDSAMMNIAAKPSVHLDSSLLSSHNQPVVSYQHRQRRSKRSLSFSFPSQGVFFWGLGLIAFALLSLGVFWAYRWLISPVNLNNFQTIVLEENFSAAQKWSLTNGAKIKDGGLFHLQPHVKHYGASIWTGRDFTNVDFSADAKKVNGPDNVPYGLVTRIGGENYQDFYYLLISGNGTWVMGKHSNNSWSPKGKWRKSKLINQGNQGTNRLRLVVKGNMIIGYINGKKVGHFRDRAFKSGKIAVTSMRGSGDAVAVYFDNIVAKIEGDPQ